MNSMVGGRGAVFLDKDGTLLRDVPFNVDPEKMRFTQGARWALEALGRTQLPLFVVSNQSGVAKGLFEEAALAGVRTKLEAMFGECGASLTDFFYCPHDPGAAVSTYAFACACRKPQPGMLLKAIDAHGVDPARSWMVGDILDDIEAGRRAGCRTILLANGNETQWDLSPARVPHYCVSTLDEAVRLILASSSARPSS